LGPTRTTASGRTTRRERAFFSLELSSEDTKIQETLTMATRNCRKARFVVEALEGRNMLSVVVGVPPNPGCPADELNPQPLPPKADIAAFCPDVGAGELNPQPLPPKM
jgi:hypothetical protein